MNINNEKYEDFFEKMKEFKEEQNKQKQRGLNDFNILTTVRKPHAEVGMHSNFLYAILNPEGLHYQGDFFVKLFIKHVLKIEDFGENIKVEVEELTTENRRIDLTIKSDKYLIGIEMKIYASDQKYQIFEYYEELEKQSENEQVLIYYLTLDGVAANRRSFRKDNKEKTYHRISFKKDILNWLYECQKEIQNILNLNEALKQYIDVIRFLTDNTYEGKVMGLEKFLLKDDNLKLMLGNDMQDALEKSKIKTQIRFWEVLKSKLKVIGYEFEYVNGLFEIEETLDNYIYRNTKFYGLKYDLKDLDSNYKLHFYIEMENNITYGFTISEDGVRKDISNNFIECKNKIEDICDWTTKYKYKDSPWWLHWNYPKTKLHFKDFSSNAIFDLVDDLFNAGNNNIVEDLSNEIDMVLKKYKELS